MARPAPTPPAPLLDAVADANARRATAAAAERDDATRLYWACADKLANGDATGGTDPKTFTAVMTTLGLTVEGVEHDVANVIRCRQAQLQVDEGEQRLGVLQGELAAAEASAAAAKVAFDACCARANGLAFAVAQHLEGLTMCRGNLKTARLVANDLVKRGFAGTTCSPAPAAQAPAPRRWRITAEHLQVAGKLLLRGSIIDLPHAAVLSHHDAVLVDTATPLVENLPAPGMPGSKLTLQPIVDTGWNPELEKTHA